MGNWQGVLKSIGWKKEEVRLLMLGLDAAGKTTILYKMKLGEIVTTIPTIGFNVETLSFKGIDLIAWDVGGRDKIRPLFRHYFANTKALIYVVDSNDRDRLEQVKEELHKFLREDELREVVLLVFANKQDLANAMSLDEVKKAIDFDGLSVKRKNIISSVATTGEGLNEGFNWIADCFGGAGPKTEILNPLKETVTDVSSIGSQFSKYLFLEFFKSKLFKSVA